MGRSKEILEDKHKGSESKQKDKYMIGNITTRDKMLLNNYNSIGEIRKKKSRDKNRNKIKTFESEEFIEKKNRKKRKIKDKTSNTHKFIKFNKNHQKYKEK
jgi:hypothetical protein